MSENQLAVQTTKENVLATLDEKNENFNVGGAGILPRLQFCTSRSKQVEDDQIKKNRFAFIQGQEVLDDFGEEMTVVFLVNRGKAVKTEAGETTIIFGDKEKEAYAEIAKQPIDLSHKHGPESLVYVPGKGFATFFWGANRSLRFTADSRLASLMKKTAVLGHKQSKNTKGEWESVTVRIAEDQLDLEEDLPLDELSAVVNDFSNPVDKLPEEENDDEDR